MNQAKTRWVYTQAYWVEQGLLAFHTLEVSADTEDEAYELGFELTQAKYPGDTPINDVVLKLEGAQP